MLLSFSVANFRSYAQTAELSLLRGAKQRAPVEDKRLVRHEPNGPDVLRAVAIFGPNAGGKSNLLKAMEALRVAVLRSAADEEALESFQPFASQEYRAKPTTMAISFLAGDEQFNYQVAILDKTVVEESLASKPVRSKSNPIQLFHRVTKKEHGVQIELSGSLKDHRDAELWQRNTRPHQLFLSQSQNLSAAPFFESAVGWFRSKLAPLNTNDVIARHFFTLLDDEHFKTRVINELIAADLGITDLRVAKDFVSYDEKGLKFMTIRKVQLVHSPSEGPQFELKFNEESDGTQYFLNLLGPLDNVIQNDRVLLIDELDRSLHPLLVRRIVKTFSQGKSKGQLVFTTHDATLLDADVLRRDQVWFAERDARHHSSLRRLASGNVRMDKALMRAYLEGQFQGVPITDSEGLFGDE